MSTRPVNGALFILNPKTGQLYMKVIHTSVWQGQKRRGPLAKWKAAEEVLALLRALPDEERPSKIVVMRQALLDPLEIQLIDYPNISIQGSEIQLPFQSLLKIELFGEAVTNAQSSELLTYSLYEDWS